MMFDKNFEVSAVVDWEQPSLGGALNDLAWWIVNAETIAFPGFCRRSEPLVVEEEEMQKPPRSRRQRKCR